jgi:hypothetical protein
MIGIYAIYPAADANIHLIGVAPCFHHVFGILLPQKAQMHQL